MTAPTRRRFRWSLRTMFVVVTAVAVFCWVYFVGWPWWQLYREQSDFEESVKQLRAGTTAAAGSRLVRSTTCFRRTIATGTTPAGEPVVFSAYSWNNACYCICYVLSGPPIGNISQIRTDRIEVYRLPPVPDDDESANVDRAGNLLQYIFRYQGKMLGGSQGDSGERPRLVHSDG